MLRFTFKDTATPALRKLEKALEAQNLDRVVERVALKTFADVVKATPKRWFGQVRASWQMQNPGPGRRVVLNDNKIMWFLEEGTRAHGPVTAKALYIPLNRKAALGYQPGMRFGVDFILKKWVRGIEARHIAAREAVKAQANLLAAMKAHVKTAIEA